ncbi:MAG: hypothetical protein HKN26_14070, partial [Acidimicrobiales bacterium]|nr:hypothetical protein [Acidimicrobiales bacterium]
MRYRILRLLLGLLLPFGLVAGTAVTAHAQDDGDVPPAEEPEFDVAEDPAEPAPEPIPEPPIDEAPPASEAPPVTEPERPDETNQRTGPRPDPDSSAVELIATVGLDGQFKQGEPTPITVTVEANRLLVGTLIFENRVERRTERLQVDIEVPGASSKQYVAVISTSQWEAMNATVELEVDGEVIEAVEVDGGYDSELELVGVMAQLASGREIPEASRLAVEGTGSARLHPISDELLRAGPDALAVYDSIAASGRDLDAMAPEELQNLLTWVDRGGHLYVDQVAAPVAGLPDPWQPTDLGWSRAGRGRVLLTGSQLGAGEWDQVLLPTPIDNGSVGIEFFEGGGSSFPLANEQRLSETLETEAGFELPSLRWLLILLASYVLLVGPIGYFVLRAFGRPQLFWLLVPLAAVLFTGFTWVTGSSIRNSTQAAHATLVEFNDGGAIARTFVYQNSRNGGDIGMVAPPSWNAATPIRTPSRSRPTTSLSAGGLRSTLSVGPGDFGLVGAVGPTDNYEHPFTVDYEQTGNGTIEGTITNNLDIRLREVAVFARGRADSIGSLDPGETERFRVFGLDDFDFGSSGGEYEVWGRFIDRGRSSRLTTVPTVNIALWDEYRTRQGPEARPMGEILVAGWTDALPSPATTLRDQTVEAGRTVLAQHFAVADAGDALTDMGSSRRMARGSNDLDFEAVTRDGQLDDFGGFGGFDQTVGLHQFSLPTEIGTVRLDLNRLAVTGLDRTDVAQVWDHDAQLWLSASDAALRDDIVLVPPGAARQGVIHLRWAINQENFWQNQTEITVEYVDEPSRYLTFEALEP